MNLNRRSILTGAVASIFMPGIVKADSLMNLRGVLMDPWVLTFNIPSVAICEYVLCYDSFGNRLLLSKLREISEVWRNGDFFRDYSIRRLSECDIVPCPPVYGNRNGFAYNPLKLS